MSIFFNPAKHPHRLKPTPLGEQGKSYNENLPMPELDFLDTIDKKQCVLINIDLRRRDGFSFPGFITAALLFIMTFHFVFNEHYNTYINFEQDLKLYTTEYKKLFEDKTQLDKIPSFIIDKYAPFFEQNNFTIPDYLTVYFSGYITGTPYIDTLFYSCFFLMALGFSIYYGYQSFFKKPRSLVFDRERNLVYTWHGGKVFVARYPEIGVGKIGKMIAFQLFGLDKKKHQLVTELFFPNVYVFSVYHTSTDYHDQRFINFMNTYMREGRDAIIQSDYHRKKPKMYFGKNPLPEDFEQQVQQILAKCDEEKALNAQHR